MSNAENYKAATFNFVSALDSMITSRESDRREGILVRQGKAFFHVSSAGHEALAVLAQPMRRGDLIFPHYRDRALMLALGIDIRTIARLFFGKAAAPGAGRQVTAHYCDRSKGIWSALSPVAHNLLPACGAAWSMKIKSQDNVVIALVGDASSRQGEFYEAVCFAVERNLPIIFVVEDNHIGISTATDMLQPLALGVISPNLVMAVDGRDPENFFHSAAAAFSRVRGGGGPIILWCWSGKNYLSSAARIKCQFEWRNRFKIRWIVG